MDIQLIKMEGFMEDITVVSDGEYLVFTNNFEHNYKIDV